MTNLIQWLTGEDTPAAPAEDDAPIDILADSRDALPPHVRQFLDLKAASD